MSRLSKKIISKLALMAAIFVVSMLAVTVAGSRGLRNTADLADSIYADHLTTLRATVETGRLLDDVYRTTDSLAATTDGAQRSTLRARLARSSIAFEVALDRLRAVHADDAIAERVSLDDFAQRWAAVRAAVVDPVSTPTATDAFPTQDTVTGRFDPLVSTVRELIAREQDDAATAREKAHDQYRASELLIFRITAAGLVAGLLTMLVLVRRVVPRALAREEDQAEFGEVIALAEDERDAQELLRRHLERAVADARTVVLRRNNSANRLELATAIPEGSTLIPDVDNAEPRSCVSVRTARAHVQSSERELLLSCRVCGECPGTSLCTPLTVGGEVIGAVLVNRTRPLDADDERRVRETVSQAAPVLANLRNLAVAEYRAATDSLTGLPNRRAVTDATRRMVAQAARSVSPMALLSLDLDHFKKINDQFGHGAGDEVLAAVGAALRATLRTSDFAGRNGGEEFVVLLPDTGVDAALDVAAKLHQAIGEIVVTAVGRRITASIGVAVLPDHAGDMESLERAADRALYSAKNNGRDRSEVCALAGPVMHTDVRGTATGPIRQLDDAR